MNVPRLPSVVMRPLRHISKAGGYNMDNGGQWEPSEPTETEFLGAVLPIGDKDLQYSPAGTYTKYSRKIYTDGVALKEGSTVYDPDDDVTYTIKQDLDHGTIHPLRRYIAEAKGGAAV